jgi:hypothetical protein
VPVFTRLDFRKRLNDSPLSGGRAVGYPTTRSHLR